MEICRGIVWYCNTSNLGLGKVAQVAALFLLTSALREGKFRPYRMCSSCQGCPSIKAMLFLSKYTRRTMCLVLDDALQTSIHIRDHIRRPAQSAPVLESANFHNLAFMSI